MSKKLLGLASSVFSLITRAAARKKIYAQKAAQSDKEQLSHLLRALSHSESIQARRILNSIKGKIDRSDQYVATLFEKEIPEAIEEYSKALDEAKKENNRAFVQAFSQLKAAETRFLAFYSKNTQSIKNDKEQKYFVCQFCGYIHTESIPEQCPICGAQKTGFKEVQ